MRDVPKRRLFVSLGLSAALWLRDPLNFSLYSAWLLSLPLVFWCAWPFHKGILRGLRSRRADSDMLVSFSVLAAFVFTTFVLFAPEWVPAYARQTLFGSLAALIVLPGVGRRFEVLLTQGSGEAIWRLTRRVPRTARVRRGGVESIIPCGEVKVGERVHVEPGEQIPLDGEIIEGVSQVDESLWTGIETPVEKSKGSRVLAGVLNKTKALRIVVLRPSEESSLARLVDSVGRGFSQRGQARGVADRMAAVYLPAVVIVAVAAALLWSWKGPEPRVQHGLTAFILVLIAACPWSLGLAAPVALAVGMRRAFRLGMRIRNPSVLQAMRSPDVLVVNKTGVLTEGRPDVCEVLTFGGWSEDEVKGLAAAAGGRSGHPYAQAFSQRKSPASQRQVASIETYPGYGVRASVDGRRIVVGSLPWLAQNGIEPQGETAVDLQAREEPLLAVGVDGSLAGVLFFNDPLREEVVSHLKQLGAMGFEVVLASGDRNAAVHRVAEQTGIKKVFAEVLDEEKIQIVGQLQASGRRVALVGEGYLDAPALSRADLGVALESDSLHESGPAAASRPPHGFDLAAEAADLVLSRRDLAGLTDAIRLSATIRKTIHGNLTLAFFTQLCLIPLAAGAFLPGFGEALRPWHAGLATIASMSVITIHSFWRLKP